MSGRDRLPGLDLHSMNHGFSVNFSPIGGSWPVLLVAVMAVTALTLWAYSQAAQGHDGTLALCCALAAAAGDPALLDGGAKAEGDAQREEETGRFARLPLRHEQEHGAGRRGERANAVERRQGDSQAGEGGGEVAGARPERQDSLLRLDAHGPQAERERGISPSRTDWKPGSAQRSSRPTRPSRSTRSGLRGW